MQERRNFVPGGGGGGGTAPYLQWQKDFTSADKSKHLLRKHQRDFVRVNCFSKIPLELYFPKCNVLLRD